MIGLITFILLFGVLAFVFKLFSVPSYFNPAGGPNIKKIGIAAGILVLCLVVSSINPITVERIDAGSVGLKVDKAGNNKGIPIAIPVKGWVFYNSWVTEIVELSIRQNHVQAEPFSVTAKGGFPLTVSPSYNYALKPDKAAALYINLLKGGDYESLRGTWLKTATELALTNATNAYTLDSMFNAKEKYNVDVTKEMNKEMNLYFEVSQINPGVSPPKEMADVIKNKTEAVQNAQLAELNRITADQQALTKIANARGDSAQLVINAKAEAEAIKVKTQEVSSTYVEYIKWLNASPDLPRVPTTVLGSSGYMVNLK